MYLLVFKNSTEVAYLFSSLFTEVALIYLENDEILVLPAKSTSTIALPVS